MQSGQERMRQQVGSGGGGVKQIQHPSQDGRWGQPSRAAALGRGGVSLCLWRGQRASCEASCGERTEAGPHPHQFFVSQLGPALRAPPPPSLGCWLPGGPGPPTGPGWRSSAGLSGPRSASSQGPVPPRTLAPIWLPHWPACRCTISRMAVALKLDAAALVLVQRTAAAKQGPCAPGRLYKSRRGSRHGPVTGPLRLLVPPRDGGCGEGRISLPSLLETPFPPSSGQWGRGLSGASVVPRPSILPFPPPARPGNLGFAGIGRGGKGSSGEGGREPRKCAAGRFSRSPPPPPPRTTLPQFLRPKPPFPSRFVVILQKRSP